MFSAEKRWKSTRPEIDYSISPCVFWMILGQRGCEEYRILGPVVSMRKACKILSSICPQKPWKMAYLTVKKRECRMERISGIRWQIRTYDLVK